MRNASAMPTRKYNPGDDTDRAGAAFLAMSGVPKEGREEQREEPVLDLLPRVHRQCFGVSLSFRIDCGKKFIIKDLTEFTHQTEDGERVLFGKSTEVWLTRGRFTEHGRRYLDFIRDVVEEEEARSGNAHVRERWYSGIEERIGGAISLYGSRLDQFFALLEEDEAEFIDDWEKEKKKGVLYGRRKEARIRLRIQKNIGKKGAFQRAGAGAFVRTEGGVLFRPGRKRGLFKSDEP